MSKQLADRVFPTLFLNPDRLFCAAHGVPGPPIATCGGETLRHQLGIKQADTSSIVGRADGPQRPVMRTSPTGATYRRPLSRAATRSKRARVVKRRSPTALCERCTTRWKRAELLAQHPGDHDLVVWEGLFEKVTLTRVGILDIFCPCWNSIDVSYSGGGRQPNYPVRSSPLCVYTKTESVVFCPRCRTARGVPRSAR